MGFTGFIGFIRFSGFMGFVGFRLGRSPEDYQSLLGIIVPRCIISLLRTSIRENIPGLMGFRVKGQCAHWAEQYITLNPKP